MRQNQKAPAACAVGCKALIVTPRRRGGQSTQMDEGKNAERARAIISGTDRAAYEYQNRAESTNLNLNRSATRAEIA